MGANDWRLDRSSHDRPLVLVRTRPPGASPFPLSHLRAEMKTRCLILSALLLVLFSSRVESQTVVRQAGLGKNACGPCAVINSLSAINHSSLNQLTGSTGVDKARTFIERFGKEQSIIYGEFRTAYSNEHGASDRDLKAMLDRFLERHGDKPTQGQYLVRDAKSSEDGTSFVARAHRLISSSIDARFHPIVCVRALTAEKQTESSEFVWNSKGGHFVTIHHVGNLSQDGLGFMVSLSDSLSGKRIDGFIYLDKTRKAVVPMDFSVDENGKEKWNWISSFDALTIVCPEMPLETVKAKWHERTLIVVRYIITK